MPFYEYTCTECGRNTEILQRMSDAPATECPSCHAPALVKQISAAGFRLKGGGWYETDFKSSGQRNLEGDSGSASGVKADAGEGKESKTHGCAAGACGCAAPAATPATTAPAVTPAPAAP